MVVAIIVYSLWHQIIIKLTIWGQSLSAVIGSFYDIIFVLSWFKNQEHDGEKCAILNWYSFQWEMGFQNQTGNRVMLPSRTKGREQNISVGHLTNPWHQTDMNSDQKQVWQCHPGGSLVGRAGEGFCGHQGVPLSPSPALPQLTLRNSLGSRYSYYPYPRWENEG